MIGVNLGPFDLLVKYPLIKSLFNWVGNDAIRGRGATSLIKMHVEECELTKYLLCSDCFRGCRERILKNDFCRDPTNKVLDTLN